MNEEKTPMEETRQEELKDSIETDIKLIGDAEPITQIVILLAFIRYHLKNNVPGDIHVSIGKHMKSGFFGLQVNCQEISDINPQESLEIN